MSDPLSNVLCDHVWWPQVAVSLTLCDWGHFGSIVGYFSQQKCHRDSIMDMPCTSPQKENALFSEVQVGLPSYLPTNRLGHHSRGMNMRHFVACAAVLCGSQCGPWWFQWHIDILTFILAFTLTSTLAFTLVSWLSLWHDWLHWFLVPSALHVQCV